MKPAIETRGTEMVVFLPEELDHPAADMIRRETDRIMGRIYIRTIVFDFAGTKFMDSSGIGLIMGRYRALGMRGGCIQGIHINTYMESLLCMSGICKIMVIRRETALAGE